MCCAWRVGADLGLTAGCWCWNCAVAAVFLHLAFVNEGTCVFFVVMVDNLQTVVVWSDCPFVVEAQNKHLSLAQLEIHRNMYLLQ